MQFKPSEFLSLAGLVLAGFIAMKKPKKIIGWFLIIACGGYLLFVIFSSDRESKILDNHTQTVTTTGNNSPVVNFSAITSGSNLTVIQAASGATVNTTINPDKTTNPTVNGDFNTIYGSVPQSVHGNGNTIVGATDSHGNTIINQSMAVGFGAHAGSNSISIGAFSGAGQFTGVNTN